MSELARFLTIVLTAAAVFACGWFTRGWWDGSQIKLGDAAQQSQQFVNAGSRATERISGEMGKAREQHERTRARTEHVEAVTSCPPGLGAVSSDTEQRLRIAFGQASGK